MAKLRNAKSRKSAINLPSVYISQYVSLICGRFAGNRKIYWPTNRTDQKSCKFSFAFSWQYEKTQKKNRRKLINITINLPRPSLRKHTIHKLKQNLTTTNKNGKQLYTRYIYYQYVYVFVFYFLSNNYLNISSYIL